MGAGGRSLARIPHRIGGVSGWITTGSAILETLAWDPDQYLRFAAQRALPFHHLVEAIEFMAEYAEQLREAYPDRAGETVFPFRRTFVVTWRRES